MNFASPVHYALLGRELLAGVPHIIMLALIMLGIIAVYMAELYWFVPVLLILYLAAFFITKKDQFLLEIIVLSLFQEDRYIP